MTKQELSIYSSERALHYLAFQEVLQDEHTGFPLYVRLHSAVSMPPEGRYGHDQGTSQLRRNADDVLEGSARKNAREAKEKKNSHLANPIV